jgi:ribosomal protein L2
VTSNAATGIGTSQKPSNTTTSISTAGPPNSKLPFKTLPAVTGVRLEQCEQRHGGGKANQQQQYVPEIADQAEANQALGLKQQHRQHREAEQQADERDEQRGANAGDGPWAIHCGRAARFFSTVRM